MARKLDAAVEDHAIRLYLAGEPIEKIAADTGVGGTLLHRIRERRGIPLRPRRAEAPPESVVAAYLAGASENALSRQYGVSRGTIARILTEQSVERRGMSEAGINRNAHMTTSERKAQAAAANRASRLRSASQIEKFRSALGREARGEFGSESEERLYDALDYLGFRPIAQRAIGPYNIDVAVPPVAVEILGGGWHATKPTHSERTPYILDEGWHLLLVWDHEGSSAYTHRAAEYVVGFINEVSRNPPATCQYRVISGNGELLAARGREDGEFPVVPPPRGRIN